MLALKRKRTRGSGSEPTNISILSHHAFSDDEIDISSALAGKKSKVAPTTEDSDDDLRDFLHDSISRRDVQNGTDVVKKAKGKGKLAKGEVGGGSFQSMGQRYSTLSYIQDIELS
jgi:ATP-dependent RNA helicase DDX54/DBP10